jgi:hypothetical protein
MPIETDALVRRSQGLGVVIAQRLSHAIFGQTLGHKAERLEISEIPCGDRFEMGGCIFVISGQTTRVGSFDDQVRAFTLEQMRKIHWRPW